MENNNFINCNKCGTPVPIKNAPFCYDCLYELYFEKEQEYIGSKEQLEDLKKIAEFLSKELKRRKKENNELYQKFTDSLLERIKNNESYRVYKRLESIIKNFKK